MGKVAMTRVLRGAGPVLVLLLTPVACTRTPRAPTAPSAATVALVQTASSAPATVRATDTATRSARSTVALSPTPTTNPAASHETFAARLRGRGVAVGRLDEAAQPYFRVFGARLRLSGGPLARPAELQAFSYVDPALAASDAARIQPDASAQWTEPDGRGRGMTSLWVATPHFFHRDGTIVLYVGDDATLLALLTDLLGPQYAGR